MEAVKSFSVTPDRINAHFIFLRCNSRIKLHPSVSYVPDPYFADPTIVNVDVLIWWVVSRFDLTPCGSVRRTKMISMCGSGEVIHAPRHLLPRRSGLSRKESISSKHYVGESTDIDVYFS